MDGHQSHKPGISRSHISSTVRTGPFAQLYLLALLLTLLDGLLASAITPSPQAGECIPSWFGYRLKSYISDYSLNVSKTPIHSCHQHSWKYLHAICPLQVLRCIFACPFHLCAHNPFNLCSPALVSKTVGSSSLFSTFKS